MTEREIEEIKSGFRGVLQEAKKKNTYVCELCGNGTGKNGDGLAVGTVNPYHLTCFKCGFKGDIIEYYKQLNNCDFPTACKELADKMHITLEQYKPQRRTTEPNKAPVNKNTSNYTPNQTSPLNSRTEAERSNTDYTELFKTCNAAINQSGNKGLEYMQSRGISLETCNKFNIGYCEAWKPPTVPTATATARVIIPNSEHGYLARAIDDKTPKQYQKQKTGEQSIFNSAAIASDQTAIFVVEGEIDAMSICEAGAVAVGLGSTSNADKLIELIDAEPKARQKVFIICGDSDEAGKKATEKLSEALKERQIDYVVKDINGAYKDANEHLQSNRAAFIELVRKEALTASEPFESDLMSNNIDRLLSTFSRSDNKAISTGFKELDEHLSGGIHKGELTLIGAAPSLGKTTLAMQIVENIAQTTNEEILIFSLEMSKAQHFAKSLSRLTWETNPNISDPKQDFFLLQAGEIINNTVTEREPLERALKQYRTYANQLHVFDSNRNINFVEETVRRFIARTGKAPIVVIDYIQLLKTDNNKATAMDVIQETISVLSRLKADYNIAIIAIVAFNRDANKDGKKVNLDSGRDTSDLEYSADTYIALNFTEWESSNTERETHTREALMRQQPRAMTAKILKKRMGEPYGKIDFVYRSHINHFEELRGNVRNISAEALKPENITEAERLQRDIARLVQVQKQLESGELDRHITEDHRRFTKSNASGITALIKIKQERLDQLNPKEAIEEIERF